VRFGLRADASDEARQDAPRPDLDEVGHATGDHAPHRRRPLHAVHEVLGQFAAQALGRVDHAGVDVAQHRHLRVPERDLGQDAAELVAGASHERRVARHADGQACRLAGADRPAHLERENERRDDTRQHDLAGRVRVCDADLAVLARLGDDLVHLLVGQPDDGAHPAGDPALLHDPSTLADESHSIRVVDGVGRDRGGVLAGRVAGHGGRADRDALVDRLGPDGLEKRDAGGQDGRLGIDRAVELLGRSFEDHAREWHAERGVGALEGGGGGGRSLDQLGPHADVLGSLAGEHEGDRARALRARIGGVCHGYNVHGIGRPEYSRACALGRIGWPGRPSRLSSGGTGRSAKGRVKHGSSAIWPIDRSWLRTSGASARGSCSP